MFCIAPLERAKQQFRLLLWYSARAVPTLLNGCRVRLICSSRRKPGRADQEVARAFRSVMVEAASLGVEQIDALLSKGFRVRTMDNHFKRVNDTEALDALIESSGERPLVIFKHSLTCPISSAAYDQMERYEGGVALIEIQNARGLSSAIASRFGVTHESPQVIVLRKGQVYWNASHFKITAEAVAKAVREAGAAV